MNEEDNCIEVEVTVNLNEKMIYLYEEDGSGCKYPYGNMKELGEIFKRYIEDALYARNINKELENDKKQICNLNKDEEEI